MRKILKCLLIIQEVTGKNKNPKLGRRAFTEIRLNPYNPLSYIFLVIIAIVGISMFGVVGFWKRTDGGNPFKWH